MKRMLICCSLLLTACGINPAPRVVYETKTIVPEIPDRFFRKCEVSTPPNRFDYQALKLEDKETKLTDYINKLNADLAVCNKQISSTQEYYQSMKKTLETGVTK